MNGRRIRPTISSVRRLCERRSAGGLHTSEISAIFRLVLWKRAPVGFHQAYPSLAEAAASVERRGPCKPHQGLEVFFFLSLLSAHMIERREGTSTSAADAGSWLREWIATEPGLSW